MDKASVNSYAATRLQAGYRPLGELLPLDTPLSLMVDPSNACNFKCVFCPTGDPTLLAQVDRPKGVMDMQLFRKLIDELALFPRPVQVLHLYKDGEPLSNKRLPEMVAYAKSSDRVKRVETTTNGSLLTPERSDALVRAGLDGIRISVYALDAVRYQTKTKRNFLGSSL
ncbi:MAG: radical SAM protein [Cyanobacteria bacterium RI_101]|nr:radical SAM protein [Cyanobacteria bacterium RI_101]